MGVYGERVQAELDVLPFKLGNARWIVIQSRRIVCRGNKRIAPGGRLGVLVGDTKTKSENLIRED